MPVCRRRGRYNPALEILSSKKKSKVNLIIPELTGSESLYSLGGHVDLMVLSIYQKAVAFAHNLNHYT